MKNWQLKNGLPVNNFFYYLTLKTARLVNLSDNKYTEQELVMRLKEKDEKAFPYLYEKYSGGLYAIIIQIVPDRELACEILQDVFINVWCKIDSYDPAKGRLFTWMLNIARNLSIDTLRSKAYRNSSKNQNVEDELDYLETVYTESTETITQRIFNSIGLKKAVEQLRPEYSNLIDLAYFKGHTQEEIAGLEGLPLGTVKTRIRNALIQLRERLK